MVLDWMDGPPPPKPNYQLQGGAVHERCLEYLPRWWFTAGTTIPQRPSWGFYYTPRCAHPSPPQVPHYSFPLPPCPLPTHPLPLWERPCPHIHTQNIYRPLGLPSNNYNLHALMILVQPAPSRPFFHPSCGYHPLLPPGCSCHGRASHRPTPPSTTFLGVLPRLVTGWRGGRGGGGQGGPRACL